MRLLSICLLAALVGCTTTRTITISTKPADDKTTIDIDGKGMGRGPVTFDFVFQNESDTHTVTASRIGYKNTAVPIRRDFEQTNLVIELKPQQKTISVVVEGVPAFVSVDGRQVSTDPVLSYSTTLDFTVDARGNWTTHSVGIERPGFQPDSETVNFNDPKKIYTLNLKPMSKDVTIMTDPPGATVLLDNTAIGVSPLKQTIEFQYDTDKNAFIPRKLRADKKGYPTQQSVDITWDDGKVDFPAIKLIPQSKKIRIQTDPKGGTVTIDGKAWPQDSTGASLATLEFPPTDANGTLKIYNLLITKKTAESEWYPKEEALAWDNGKPEYSFPLKEIKTVHIPLMTLSITRDTGMWLFLPGREDTIAAKDWTESSKLQVQKLTPDGFKGQNIDSLAVSPDGRRLVFSVLEDKPEFRSRLYAINTDGTGGADLLNDGRSLDITPSFSPDGDQILFSSNRSGKHLSVWSIAAKGATGAQQYTAGDTDDLWPNMDSDPRPRIFCQSFTDRLARPRLFVTPVGTILRSDLGIDGAMQPRINAKNDTVLYSAYNENTRKRDIFRVADRGGVPEYLTNTPDVDEYDAVWDRDGGRIAYVSDAGMDPDKQRHNADIWIRDLNQPNSLARQITTNESQDDHPAWDPSGRAIYFRSNRGGEWGIWKITLNP